LTSLEASYPFNLRKGDFIQNAKDKRRAEVTHVARSGCGIDIHYGKETKYQFMSFEVLGYWEKAPD